MECSAAVQSYKAQTNQKQKHRIISKHSNSILKPNKTSQFLPKLSYTQNELHPTPPSPRETAAAEVEGLRFGRLRSGRETERLSHRLHA